MAVEVIILCAPGDGRHGEHLSEALMRFGYKSWHTDQVLVGDSVLEELSKRLERDAPVIICGTVRAAGSKWLRAVAARVRSRGDLALRRLFPVRLERDAYLETLFEGTTIAECCDDFAKGVDDLMRSLRAFLESQITPVTDKRAVFAVPPALYAVPSYNLTNAFVGRTSELKMLDDWANSPESVMVVEGIGGLGKSALTWEWVNERAPTAIPGLAGRIWWSFYDQTTSMVAFVRHALAYVTARDPHTLAIGLSHQERGQQLLAELKARPILLVLDGFERTLTAYHQLNSAQIPDDRVQEHLRDCISPQDEELLTQLMRCSPSKVLISTRLFPAGLEDRAARRPINGVARHYLDGLAPDDAIQFFHNAGVKGSDERMLEFGERFGRHSLLLKIICGMINDYPPRPGDFDKWLIDPLHGGKLKLTEVNLTDRYNHILHHALGGLNEFSLQLLCRAAVVSESATYDMLAVLNPKLPQKPARVPYVGEPTVALLIDKLLTPTARKGLHPDTAHALKSAKGARAKYRNYQAAVEQYYRSDAYYEALKPLDPAIKTLVERGLLQRDRGSNRYSMHPIVRAFAAEQLEASDRKNTFHRVRDHFSGLPPDNTETATELSQVAQTVEIYRCLIGEELLEDAVSLFKAKLGPTLLHQIGAYPVVLELLKPLFSDGSVEMPRIRNPDSQSFVLGALVVAYGYLARQDDAFQVMARKVLLDLDRRNWGDLNVALMNQTILLVGRNRLAESSRTLSIAVTMAKALKDEQLLSLAICRELEERVRQGRFVEATSLAEEFRRRPPLPIHLYRKGHAELAECRMLFFDGKLTNTALQTGLDLALAQRNVTAQYELIALRSEMEMGQGRAGAALDSINEALQITNRLGTPRPEYHELRAWALVTAGRTHDARAQLKDSGSRLFAAKAYHLLGEITLARGCARNAYSWAWADGPPHFHSYYLQQTCDLMATLGEPEPQLPALDPSKVSISNEKKIRAAIAEIKRTRTWNRNARR